MARCVQDRCGLARHGLAGVEGHDMDRSGDVWQTWRSAAMNGMAGKDRLGRAGFGKSRMGAAGHGEAGRDRLGT